MYCAAAKVSVNNNEKKKKRADGSQGKGSVQDPPPNILIPDPKAKVSSAGKSEPGLTSHALEDLPPPKIKKSKNKFKRGTENSEPAQFHKASDRDKFKVSSSSQRVASLDSEPQPVVGGMKVKTNALQNDLPAKKAKHGRADQAAEVVNCANAPSKRPPAATGEAQMKTSALQSTSAHLDLLQRPPPTSAPVPSAVPSRQQPAASTSSSLLDKMAARLQGGRFRSLNEALYTCTGSEALTMMEDAPDLFSHYHDGFQQQTKGWPVQVEASSRRNRNMNVPYVE